MSTTTLLEKNNIYSIVMWFYKYSCIQRGNWLQCNGKVNEKALAEFVDCLMNGFRSQNQFSSTDESCAA